MFKKGDKIKRKLEFAKQREWWNDLSRSSIKPLTVLAIDGIYIRVSSVPGNWQWNRFELEDDSEIGLIKQIGYA